MRTVIRNIIRSGVLIGTILAVVVVTALTKEWPSAVALGVSMLAVVVGVTFMILVMVATDEDE